VDTPLRALLTADAAQWGGVSGVVQQEGEPLNRLQSELTWLWYYLLAEASPRAELTASSVAKSCHEARVADFCQQQQRAHTEKIRWK